MLADYLSSMQAKSYPNMSAIELADIQIPGMLQSMSNLREFLITVDSDFDSGYDAMVGVEESGPAIGIHNQE